MVDNGYGAITRINYVSAKDHPEGGHQVPFPEIVVSLVSTTGSLNLGGNITGSHYAYGGAELVFDSALDRFVFPGYQRFVDLRIVGPSNIIAPPPAMATVTATWPLTQFTPGMSKKDRWLRMQRVGRVQDVFLIRNAGNNPWSLLGVDANDGRTMGVTHHEWDAKFYESTDPTGSFQDCMDMINPYDFQRSLINNATNGLNVCRSHGFAFGLSKQSWYGPWAPPTNNNIQTRSTVKMVDDFGRVTYAEYEGDLFRGDDNICVESTFATPKGLPRVLNALAARQVLSCDGEMTVAKESYEYDQLPWGVVSDGRVTSHSIERRSTNSGELLKTIRAFDATYDSVGNVKTVRTQRGSDTRTVSFEYDPFGLAPVYSRVDASGVAATGSFVSYDVYSLAPLIFTDEHQTQWGSVFDGFGRLIQSTVTPAGGDLGVTSTVSYQGFTQPEASGRRVVLKEFPTAVPPGQVATSASRTATAFLDELGRLRRTDVNLGTDYANQILVVGSRTYDDVGRVVFEADPYPNNQDPAKAYGTTYHFSTSGDLECAIRGRGKQPLNKTTDVAAERFPTCYQRHMVDHRDTLEVRDPSALMPQGSGVVKRIVSTALGRVIERSTVRNDVRLDYVTFAYDSLGQQRAITRFLKPAIAAAPVDWWWQLDSLGQTLEVREPQTAQRSYSYSDWGEPIEARWTDGGIARAVKGEFDALGRLTRVAEFNNGIEDDTTVKKYGYDVGVNASSHVSPTFVLGRLASASTPEGRVSFSYDAFGRVNGRTFSDTDGKLFVEKQTGLHQIQPSRP
jgi:YD repeat-containing protein